MKILTSLIIACILQQASAQDFTGESQNAFNLAREKYLHLNVPDSAYYKAYFKLYNECIAKNSNVFDNPAWPLLLANKTQERVGVIDKSPTRVSPSAEQLLSSSFAKMAKKSKTVEQATAAQTQLDLQKAKRSGDQQAIDDARKDAEKANERLEKAREQNYQIDKADKINNLTDQLKSGVISTQEFKRQIDMIR